MSVEPTPPHGSKCPDAETTVSFTEVDQTPFKLTPNGSFKGTGYFSPGKPQLTFTVRGRFVSGHTATGIVIGNEGCGTDKFKISVMK